MTDLHLDLERHQTLVYAAAVLAAVVAATRWPAHTVALQPLIDPVLVALLYATFLQVPFADLRAALGHGRFLAASLGLNFVVVPLVAWGLVHLFVRDPVVVVGALLVLLTPCIDYVVTFTRLARGDAGQVAATTPALMLLQLLLLPLYLWAFVGAEVARSVEPRPMLEAFLLIIVLPLVAAWLTELGSKHNSNVERLQMGVVALSVPLVALTLFVIVASQLPRVQDALVRLLPAVAVYVAFLVVMPTLAWFTARLAKMEPRRRTALVFTTVTRNSLVVLPLALAFPAAYALVPAVVVTQTLVELMGMLVLTNLLGRRAT